MIPSMPAPGASGGSATALSAHAIPFAQAPAISASSAGFAIAVTLALLAFVAIGMWLARRHGWLRPWLGARDISVQATGLKVITRARVSPTARAMVLEYEGRRLLIVESSQHLAINEHPTDSRVDD